MPNTEVSIVLGSYNRCSFLKTTIESIRKNGITVPYEIIVVDGGSSDGSLRWLSKQRDVLTIVQHNRGRFKGKEIKRRSWGYFMNLAFRATEGKYVVMVSDDCLLIPGAIMEGITLANQKVESGCKLGALAFYWRNWPDDEEFMVGHTLGDNMFVNHGLYLRSALEDIGWIDEGTFQFYHADGDLCLKLWDQGYEVLDSPNSFVEHFTHANNLVRSSNSAKQLEDWKAYLSKWEHKEFSSEGSWSYRQFEDKSHTYKMFPKKEILKYRMIKRISLINRWLKTLT